MTALVAPWPLPPSSEDDGADPVLRPVLRATARIDVTEHDIHAWVRVDRAATPGTDGPLAGVPVGVKDIVDVAGMPTRCGSTARRDAPPAAVDADIVARLRTLGAAPLGKTVTTEFAYFEPGPTRNPHDTRCTPGGSSSGSAAAVAAGMVPLAVGTQTAGSTVRPAAFCGVTGYALPRGVLPTTGITPLAPSLDTIGLFTADVASMAVVRAALDGLDRPPDPPPTTRLLAWDGGMALDPAMRAVWTAAVAGARRDGAEVGGPPPVDVDALAADHRTVMAYEAARALPDPTLLAARTAELVDEGALVTATAHRDALARAADARAAVLDALSPGGAILAPAATGPAPRGLRSTGDPSVSAPWHLLGLPALAVPGWRDERGMPLGLALLGHPEREHELLALGRWVETLV